MEVGSSGGKGVRPGRDVDRAGSTDRAGGSGGQCRGRHRRTGERLRAGVTGGVVRAMVMEGKGAEGQTGRPDRAKAPPAAPRVRAARSHRRRPRVRRRRPAGRRPAAPPHQRAELEDAGVLERPARSVQGYQRPAAPRVLRQRLLAVSKSNTGKALGLANK